MLDKIDFGIIRNILIDSRYPFSKIASNIGVSTDTVIRRYNKLKKAGVFRPIIDIDIYKLGYRFRVWYTISLEPQIKLSSVINEVKKITDVHRIIKAVGDYDLLVVVAAKNIKHMYEIGDVFTKIPGVKRIEGRPYLPSENQFCSASSASGFFNSNLL